MASRRQQRVAKLIHQEISNALQFNIQDPRIGFITVTDVDVSPDLRLAVVYVSVFQDDELEVLDGLNSAVPFLRRELGQNLNLRYTPELQLKVDHSVAYGQKIDTLLAEIDIPPDAENELGAGTLTNSNNDSS